MVAWLQQQQVREVAMESTAQYWKPVWIALEPHFRLHLAQARSNKAPKGRKSDFKDAVRIVKLLLADDLTLSYVPDAEQRRWRLLTRSRQQLTRDRVRLQNQIEGLLEEGQIKLSSVVSDLLGVSGYRLLRTLAKGESDLEKPSHQQALARLCRVPGLMSEAAHQIVAERPRFFESVLVFPA